MLIWIIDTFVLGFVLPLILSISSKGKTNIDLCTNDFMVKKFHDSDIEIDDIKFSESSWDCL